MADPAPPSFWTWMLAALTAFAPSLNAIVITLLTISVGVSGYAGYKIAKPANPLPIGAADVPKEQGRLPTPIACAENFHVLETKGDLLLKASGQLQTDLTELRRLAEERLPPPAPRRAPSKTKAALVP